MWGNWCRIHTYPSTCFRAALLKLLSWFCSVVGSVQWEYTSSYCPSQVLQDLSRHVMIFHSGSIYWLTSLAEDRTFLMRTYKYEHLSQSIAWPQSDTVKSTISAFKCSTMESSSLHRQRISTRWWTKALKFTSTKERQGTSSSSLKESHVRVTHWDSTGSNPDSKFSYRCTCTPVSVTSLTWKISFWFGTPKCWQRMPCTEHPKH